MTAAVRMAIVAAALAAAACGGSDRVVEPGGGDDAVASVSISPETRTLAEGEQFTATATPRDAQGRPVAGRTVTWSSSNEGVATVSQAGVVTAVGEGTTQVKATSEGRWNSATVTVVRSAVASVELDIESLPLEEGGTRQLVATPKDAAGKALSGRGMTWTSSDEGVARVGALGLVTAIRPGTATITVKVEGKTDAATIAVSADYDYDLVYDAWRGDAGQFPQLYREDIRHPGGMPARILPGVQAIDATPSPDGTRIAYVVVNGGQYDIYVAGIDGTGATRLTDGALDEDQPAWSPDGTRIAYRRWDLTPGTGHSDIWVMNADGSDKHGLTADQGRTNQTAPAWSPRLADGSYRIAYSSQTNDAAGEAHIWTMSADGSDKRQITTGAFEDEEPAWSPDGTTIAFQRVGSAIFGDLYLVDAAGTGVRRLMVGDLAFGQFSPAWSPDGKLIAFSSKHEGGIHQIYTVWADGSKLARRTVGDSNKEHPVWIHRVP